MNVIYKKEEENGKNIIEQTITTGKKFNQEIKIFQMVKYILFWFIMKIMMIINLILIIEREEKRELFHWECRENKRIWI